MKNKTLFWVLGIVLALAAAAGVWFFVVKKKMASTTGASTGTAGPTAFPMTNGLAQYQIDARKDAAIAELKKGSLFGIPVPAADLKKRGPFGIPA